MRLTELFTQTTTLFTSSERYHDVRPAVNSSTIYRIVLGRILNILTFMTFIWNRQPELEPSQYPKTETDIAIF